MYSQNACHCNLIEVLHIFPFDFHFLRFTMSAKWVPVTDPGRALQVLWDDPQGAENSAVCSLLARSGRGSYYC